jgi:hypothetical protein
MVTEETGRLNWTEKGPEGRREGPAKLGEEENRVTGRPGS